MDLLSNAISSIRLGVEDYRKGSSDRMLSSVRNLHAGVLLLYKEALRRKSPPDSNDVLVKAQIRPKLMRREISSSLESARRRLMYIR
jgi:hypothetical protein